MGDAPAAVLSVLDRDRPFLMASCGLPDGGRSWGTTPLTVSLGHHAGSSQEPFILEDVRTHALLADAPAVEALGLVSFLGVPLMDGHDTVVGIDVSKDTLDIGVLPSGEEWSTGQSPEEVEALAERSAALKPALGVLEATGGLELPIVYALVERGGPVHRPNPKRAIFSVAEGQRIDIFGGPVA